MTVIANRQLTGNYGTVVAGQTFDVEESIGTLLLRDNLVRLATPPRIQYDTKVITPRETPEVGATRERFPGDVSVPNKESPDMAADRGEVLPESDLPETGVIGHSGRAGYPRSTTRR